MAVFVVAIVDVAAVNNWEVASMHRLGCRPYQVVVRVDVHPLPLPLIGVLLVDIQVLETQPNSDRVDCRR